jgi:radical SAM superfamily enzyme YgiQ (UPF0313 family)
MLSGRLSACCDLLVLDAIAERMAFAELLKEIDAFAPAVVISLIGAVSIEEDCSFLAMIARPQRRILVSGDVVLENAATWLRQHPFIDAALLDFTGEEILAYLQGTDEPLRSIVTRAELAGESRRERHSSGTYSLPVPRHDLFTSQHYRFPFVRQRSFATVLTDFGCPFACGFCNMGGIGYKCRPIDNILEELAFLRELGKRELFFIDQSFGANKSRALNLCRAMAKEGPGFGWVCFSRADLLDEELLDAMHYAGCHTIIIGVESGDEAILDRYGKGCTKDRIRTAFALCRERKIRTVATFILGLPEETRESATSTVKFARELNPDFVSFNVAVPRMGTVLRRQAIDAGLVAAETMTMDQSGTSIAMPTRYLTIEEVQRIRRSAIISFYARPGYLWRRLTSVASCRELGQHLAEGWGLLRNLLGRGVDR